MSGKSVTALLFHQKLSSRLVVCRTRPAAPVQPMAGYPPYMQRSQNHALRYGAVTTDSNLGAKLWDVRTSQRGSPHLAFSGESPTLLLWAGTASAPENVTCNRACRLFHVPQNMILASRGDFALSPEHHAFHTVSRLSSSADCMSESVDWQNSITGSTAFHPSDLLPEDHAFIHGMRLGNVYLL